MWNRSRPMRASSSSAWKSPTSTKSTVSRRPSPSSRRTRRAIRAPRSPPRPRFTTICACCMRAPGARSARNCGKHVIRDTVDQIASEMLMQPAGSRWYALFPIRETCEGHTGAARPSLRVAQEGFSRACSRAAGPLSSPSPESLLEIDFFASAVCPGRPPRNHGGSAPTHRRHRRDLLSRGRRSGLRSGRRRRRTDPLQREVLLQSVQCRTHRA